MPKKLVDIQNEAMEGVAVIRPNKGPQEEFLSSTADIVIYGGAAGAGKSYAMLLEPLRNKDVQGFEGAIFRREDKQITAGGGLWDTSHSLYPSFGAEDRSTPRHEWRFKRGAKLVFSHLQYEKSVKAWDGAQLAFIGFDELQHFTETQFFYMLSRNRSTCGVRSYIRATCNPDPDSFLVKLLAWWIDEEGYPIKERSGVVRWFVRTKGVVEWFDSYDDVVKRYPNEIKTGDIIPKSFTFISATLDDNPKLLELDPSYKGNLNAMFEYERLRLLKGNWFARPQAGELFKTNYWQYCEASELPHNRELVKRVRYWDRAGAVPSDVTPDPDYTSGALLSLYKNGKVYVEDVRHFRAEPYDVQQQIVECAKQDPEDTEIWLERDPGQAGKMEVGTLARALIGYPCRALLKRTSKLTFWKPFATYVKERNVVLVRGAWNRAFVDELAGVTDGTQNGHDDQADASSGAFMVLARHLNKDAGAASAVSNMGVSL